MPIHHSILENGYLFSGKGSFVPAHLLGPYLVEYVDCVEFHRKYYLLLKSLRLYYCMISWKTKCSTMQKSGTLMETGKMAEIRRSSNEGNCIVCQIVLFDMMPARLQWPIYYFNIDVPPNDWNSYRLFAWFYLFCASMLFGVWTFKACGDTWFGYDFSWEYFGYYVIYRLDLKSTFKLFDLCKMPKPFKSTSCFHLAKRKRKRNCDLNQIIIVTPRPIRISFEV